MPEKKSIQQAIDEIELFASQKGYGVFEAESGEEDVRGDFHVIPCTRSGLAIPPHIVSIQCECAPKCIKDEPVKIFVHQPIVN